MTILFVGGEMGAFTPSDSTVIETTDATGRNASFSRVAILAPATTNYAEGDPGASVTNGWAHFRMGAGVSLSNQTITRFVWLDGSGVERIRLRQSQTTVGGGGTIGVDYFDGAWTSIGTVPFSFSGNVGHDFDINVVCNSASGEISLYIAGNQRVTATVDLSATTSLQKVRFPGYRVPSGAIINLETYVSQVIIADEPTIGMRLLTVPPTGTGASSDFTGTSAEVDEGTYSDADFINTSTANHVELFTHSSVIPAGYGVRAVGVTARAKRGASGPTNLQLAIRSGGTTYTSASKALDLGYGAFVNVWETDPATSAAFTTSAINALQFGVKAIA